MNKSKKGFVTGTIVGVLLSVLGIVTRLGDFGGNFTLLSGFWILVFIAVVGLIGGLIGWINVAYPKMRVVIVIALIAILLALSYLGIIIMGGGLN